MELGSIYVIVSSTYLFHLVMYVDNFGIIFLPKSTMKILTITGSKRDSIATPSFWLDNLS